MSFIERIPRVLQLAAAVVTLTGGAIAVVNMPPFQADPDASATPAATTARDFPGTRDTILNEPPHIPPVAVLTDIRLTEQAGYDRVTFEFRDNSPGYRVEYVTDPREEFSDEQVDVAGEAYLRVQLRGAQAHAEGESTLTERRYDPGLPSVTELVVTGDAGGQVTAVIGLTQPLDYRVDRAIDPFRTVIEIAHP